MHLVFSLDTTRLDVSSLKLSEPSAGTTLYVMTEMINESDI